ncbi:MAG: bifunctional isocitrate dehydrogenase kinase/phosphatase, partial [Gammaproteobacteria bacterium]|nr:bifunctional isocitrate dehydrogenase kinase/phosphatase [Gammaproteobacteria bacterium]
MQAVTVHDYAKRLRATSSPQRGARIVADWVAQEFAHFYATFQQVPGLAQQAFERSDHPRSLQLSSRRLSLYSSSIIALGDALKAVFPGAPDDPSVWDAIGAFYTLQIETLYEADIAIAYFHSVRRRVYQGEWWPVEYSLGSLETEEAISARILRVFPGGPALSPDTVVDILGIPRFSAPYRDLNGDAAALAQRFNDTLAAQGQVGFQRVEMINAGFFRNRGAYLVGRAVLNDASLRPFIVALLNEPRG